MEQHAVGGKNYAGKCFVCHSNCLADAEQTAEALRARYGFDQSLLDLIPKR